MSAPFASGYALLIGVNENYLQDWALPDVQKDIVALEQVLIHPQRCGYLRDHVRVVTGQAATRSGILDGLDWLKQRIRADTSGDATAILYFSGHGLRDTITGQPQFYLVPYDMREDAIASRALRATDLSQAVDALRPKRLLVLLDCCHAGGMGVKGGPAGRAPMALPEGYGPAALPPSVLMAEGETTLRTGAKGWEALQEGSGRAVLSSSQGTQSSYMLKNGQMSIFTYHLIEALTGHAQPQEGAKQVLVSDVMGHVWRHVPETATKDQDAEQAPDYQVTGNFPIALLLGGEGWAKGQPAPNPLQPPPAVAPPGGIHGQMTFQGPTKVDGDLFIGTKTTQGDEVRGDKIEAHVEDVAAGAQVAVGKDIQQQITYAPPQLTPAQDREIEALVAGLQSQLAALDLPQIKKAMGQEFAQQLQQELTRKDERPDASVIKVAGSWLLDNVPALAGALTGIFVNPIVGLVVQAAGDIAVRWAKERFGTPGAAPQPGAKARAADTAAEDDRPP